MNRLSLLAGAALGLTIPAAARAANIAVPFQQPTIPAAINIASNNDVILVSPGTYLGPIDMMGKGITLRSTNGPMITILDGNFMGSVITCDSGEDENTIIDGFTITHGTGTTLGVREGGGGILNFTSSPTVQNCIFVDNAADDGGAIYNYVANPLITNCVFIDNSASGFNGIGGALYNNFSNPVMTNCTVTANFATHGGGLYATQGSPRLINSIVYGNTPDAFYGPNQVIASYCDLSVPNYPGAGNISATPLFVNVGAGDVHLAPGSPCIDRGDSTAIATTFFEDLLGDPRGVDDGNTIDNGVAVFGLTVDMGALEFQGGACPGDIDGSGDVGFNDIIQLVTNWGPCPQ